MYKFFHLFSLLAVFSAVLFVQFQPVQAASCDVSGYISVDTTWSPANCAPYTVTGSLTIQPGITLTIEAGTRVEFTANTALTVYGALVALGADGSPIIFTSNLSPSAGEWDYIYFAPTSADATYDGSGNYTGGSTIQYATIEYAGDDANSYGAVRVESAAPFLDHLTIYDNLYAGVDAWNDGRPRLTNSLIDNNRSYGVSIVDLAGPMLVSGNTISHHIYGVDAYLNNGSLTLSANTISFNYWGIQARYYGQVSLLGNTVTDNTRNGIQLSSLSSAIVQNNTVSANQQGLFLYYAATAQVTGNTFTGNGVGPSYLDGAGLYLASDAIVQNNTIANNTAETFGGGVYIESNFTTNFSYNQVTGNSTFFSGGGGGIYVDINASPAINNNDLYNNTADYGSDLYDANLADSANLNAQNNYWGTTDPAIIEAHIWDYTDDPSLGIVNYVPYLNSPPPTITPTPQPSDTPTPSLTPTPTQTSTASQTPTNTLTPTITSTPTETSTPSPTPTDTLTPNPVTI